MLVPQPAEIELFRTDYFAAPALHAQAPEATWTTVRHSGHIGTMTRPTSADAQNAPGRGRMVLVMASHSGMAAEEERLAMATGFRVAASSSVGAGRG